VARSPAYTEASRRTAHLAGLGSAVLADLTLTVIGLSAMSVVGLTTNVSETRKVLPGNAEVNRRNRGTIPVVSIWQRSGIDTSS
jgi:hypothetical protein